MPKFTLWIDQEGADLLDFQKYDKRCFRGCYLLRDTPDVQVITRGGFIEDCVGYALPVLVDTRTSVVTIFCGEPRQVEDAEPFSQWLRRNFS